MSRKVPKYLLGQVRFAFLVKKTVDTTFRTVVMILIIMTSAMAFSQILSFSGANEGLIKFVMGLPLSPIMVIVCMQVIVLIMGCLMDVTGIIMITIPIFIPIVRAIGFDPLAFLVAMLLNIETAMITPPFGMSLFVMKAVAPKGTTMADVYKAAFPFIGCSLLAMILIIVFPLIALWLPGMAGTR